MDTLQHPTDYLVLTDITSNGLANQVVEHLVDGWKPVGGVAMTPHPAHERLNHWFLFAQAMAR